MESGAQTPGIGVRTFAMAWEAAVLSPLPISLEMDVADEVAELDELSCS